MTKNKFLVFNLFILTGIFSSAVNAQDLLAKVANGAGGAKYTFTRDTSIAALGEAWKDPSGMIWGDISKKLDGSINHMNQQEAANYCTNLGVSLPTKEDFARLREYMGVLPRSENEDGYIAQVLPNMADKNGNSYFFWSSSPHPYLPGVYFDFFTLSGIIGWNSATRSVDSVRCVTPR